MAILSETNYDYLIDRLRLHLGDIDSSSYRYMDEWLRTALSMAIKKLQRWWNYRYLINTDNDVYRNSRYSFQFSSPPIIQHKDEDPIILMASIIIKEGSLENASWDSVSWKDAEISYSNLEGSRARRESLKNDWEALFHVLTPPSKRLAKSIKGSLPGYIHNEYDRFLGNK
jgi:hypothetical protein